MARIIGYARCSTTDTKQDIERQVADLKARGAQKIYKEYESGAKWNRVELAAVIEALGEGDTLIATEPSRLTRSLSHLCAIIDEIKARKVKLICGSLVVDCTASKLDAMTIAMLQIMGVFAELERSLTVERIHSGLAHAKSKGVKLGRPKMTAGEVPELVRILWPRYVAGEITKAEYAKLAGISRTSMYKYISLLSY